MSSAQAAATAAFKAKAASTNKKENAKPRLRLPREAMVYKGGGQTPVQTPQTKTPGAAQVPSPYSQPAAKPLPRSLSTNEIPTQQHSTQAEAGDYFSPRENGTKDAMPGRSKVATNTRPQDMLDSVRHSIMSKSKTNTSKESFIKNQAAINEFRQSVDLKRVTTPNPGESSSHSVHSGLPAERGRHSSSSLISSLTSDPGYVSHSNLSHSSIGSAISENDPSDSSLPNPIVTVHNSDSDEMLRTPSNPAITPIVIPPSPNAMARQMALVNENMPNLSLSQPVSSSDALTESNVHIVKPGRKPPPSENLETPRTSGPRESFESDHWPQACDTDESSGPNFPLFPDLTTKYHGRGALFKKKKKAETKGVVYDPAAQKDDEFDLIPSSNSNPVNTQPVKLKTTMRKTSKRKERKTLFNEDKPWKNQKDLEVISEQQRKRYEGLWVSNKGLYMDRVVTRLVGVDYSGSETPQDSGGSRLSEKDIIERAAKLSSKAFTEADQSDFAALHALKEASTGELIHGAIVKRLWSRSKLSPETLAAIWNLVDFRRDGTLNKSEFIVGMWCVDQCLYGRKLPKVVSQSVWASLDSLGVNVTIKKKRR